MTSFRKRWLPVAFLPLLLLSGPAPVHAAEPIVINPCKGFTAITTVTDLQNIKNNLAGKYCLNNDLDLASIPHFTPIGSGTQPFSGQFNGQGHVIRNLTINSSASAVGLFARVAGSIFNLGIVNAAVTGTAAKGRVGILAGEIDGSVDNAHSSGSAHGAASWISVGGLVGYVGDAGSVTRSWSSAAVTATNNCDLVCSSEAGGLAGTTIGMVTTSFATGAVSCGGTCFAGGLIGQIGDATTDPGPPIAFGTVLRSFATGPVRGNGANAVGGLVGVNGGASMAVGGPNPDSQIQQSYAVGPVVGNCSFEDSRCFIGGLAGANFGTISQSYAVGSARGTAVDSSVFLISGLATTLFSDSPEGTVSHSYWDKNTTGQTDTTYGGTPKTTAQLQLALPSGFAVPPWAITPAESYPYFSAGVPAFAAALATTVVSKRVFALVPISQSEPSEYLSPPKSKLTSLATVYTMIARAVGVTDGVVTLKNVKIDKYFWIEKTQTATWIGPVTADATLGTMTTIPTLQALNSSNVIGALDQRKVVILRGSYTGAPRGVSHYMLATLYTKDSTSAVTAVIANDPFTGQQIKIDPLTKKVVFPANFPLMNFTVNGYQPVTFSTSIRRIPSIADAQSAAAVVPQ